MIFRRIFDYKKLSTLPIIDGSTYGSKLRLIIQYEQRKTFISVNMLKIEEYAKKREYVHKQFGDNKALFNQSLTELLNDNNSKIQSEDLKNLIFLANNDDVEILKKCIKKYSKESKLSFGAFSFGTIVCRLGHYLNDPAIAMMLMDEDNISFFSQLSSVLLSLDLLFKNGKYQEVIDLYNYVNEKYKFRSIHTDFVTIYAAASYKLNTNNSFENFHRHIRKLNKMDIPLKSRTMCFILALAIKQNRPRIALEIIHDVKIQDMNNYDTTFQSLKLMALSDLQDFNSIFNHMIFWNRQNFKNLYLSEAMDYARKRIEVSNKKEIIEKFNEIEKLLNEKGCIVKDKTIEGNLFSPIEPSLFKKQTEINTDKHRQKSQVQY